VPTEERSALPAPDQLLTAPEVAARLGVAPRTVYKRAAAYPFRVPTDGRELRFSADGLARYLARRLTKKAS
jgi:predicted DNA-binding transcriptional regulator AlpA